uniref:Uncharacterized protein n=1 Tax=Glossina morsitans morsitans TaxID=37546 RepID=A0A1B0FGR6_GLOMM
MQKHVYLPCDLSTVLKNIKDLPSLSTHQKSPGGDGQTHKFPLAPYLALTYITDSYSGAYIPLVDKYGMGFFEVVLSKNERKQCIGETLPLLLPPPPPPPAPPPHDDVMLLLLSLAFNIVSSVLAVESLCNVAVAIVGDVDVDDEVVVPNVPILGNGGETAAETRELVEFIREAAFNTVGDSVLTSVVVVAEVLVKAVAFAVVGDFVVVAAVHAAVDDAADNDDFHLKRLPVYATDCHAPRHDVAYNLIADK